MPPEDREFRKLLADDVRWDLLEQLAQSDRTVQELVDRVGRPQNLISYHLAKLRRAGLVTQRRSSADARDLYCQLDLERFTDLYLCAASGVQPALALSPGREAPPDRAWRVLFVCTGNSARSQMAEAFARAFGQGVVEAESAGTDPRPIHPLAIRVLHDLGVSMADQHSKPLEQVGGHHIDQVITLCDLARESCPPIPGVAGRAHWSLPDPAAVRGSEDERYQAFRASAAAIEARVRRLLVRIGAERQASTERGDA